MHYFESDSELERKVSLAEKLFVYSSRKNGELTKKREVFQISVYYAETSQSHFYKLHVSRIYKQYQIGDKISRYIYAPEKPQITSNAFSCTVSKSDSAVRFGPKGNLGMLDTEYRNRGLGRFCMAYIVRELLSKGFGNYTVASPSLSYEDARTEYYKLIRNYFYNNSGFKFIDIEIESGRCSAPTVLALSSSHNKSKVREITQERATRLLLRGLKRATKLENMLEVRDRKIHFLEYTEERLNQKYSVAMISLTMLAAYIIWTLPMDLTFKWSFILVSGFISYLFFYNDFKKWFRRIIHSTP